MRDQWYGDKRDLVKWGVLLELAKQYGAKRIIQIAYYRPSKWGSLEIDGRNVSLPSEVVEHFRNLRNIKTLTTHLRIDVIAEPFENRDHYMREIFTAIKACGRSRCIVFLDPDTGLAPRKPRLEHVLPSELSLIWGKMRRGDVLVFYQHQTNKNGKPWIEPKHVEFERALDLPKGRSKIAKGPTIARDVVFFFCKKAA